MASLVTLLERMPSGAGTKGVSTPFPKAEPVRIWERIFVGAIKPTADRRSNSHRRKPQMEGAGAERALAWPMIGEDLNERGQGCSTKNAAAGQRIKNRRPARREPAGDARSNATLPGAAARAPNEQARDVRPRGATTKVRTPFRQTRHATLKSRLCFWRTTRDRGTRQRTHKIPAPARRDVVFCPVGDAERHDVRSGHPIKCVHVRSGRRNGRRHEPAYFR